MAKKRREKKRRKRGEGGGNGWSTVEESRFTGESGKVGPLRGTAAEY